MARSLLLAMICVLTFRAVVVAQEKTVNNGVERPKLVVGIVVDQMRWDYLYRYYNRFGDNGFKKLMQKGFSYENCFIPYTPAVTAAGHASLYTGSIPAVHGIVGNDWVDRKTGKWMYCSKDDSVSGVGTASLEGRMSPGNMLTTTIGDELRLATNFKSRVFGIALKDRGSILPVGHSGNAAFWFDDSTGRWISSTYYMKALPNWMNTFNDERKPDSLLSLNWNLLYDPATYEQSTPDERPYEKTFFHEKTKVFPHVYTPINTRNYFRIRQSHHGNTLTTDLAIRLIENEKLGASGQTDMLCVSYSSTDYIVHRNGPNSMEAEDTYLRLDREIGLLLAYLDKTLGTNNYLVFLSADHGAPQVPDFMKENRLPGGSLNSWGMIPELNNLCAEKYKTNAKLVQTIYEYQVYLDTKKIDSLKLDVNDIKKTVIQYLLDKPEVVNAFAYSEFEQLVLPLQVKEKFAKGYFPKRSGDVQFILKPQYTDILSTGTEHGTWYNYDTHIPLLWYGWKIRPGRSNRETYITDVAPTVAAMLRVQMPNGCVGKVLEEVLPQ